MLSFLRCVLCCDDELNTGHSNSDHGSSSHSYNYHVIPNYYDPFSKTILPNSIPSTQTATTTHSQNYSTSFNFPQRSKTPSVYNQPKQTLQRTNVKVTSGVDREKTPDIPTATRTNVFPKSTSSSSYLLLPPPPSPKLGSSSSSPFGAFSGSQKSPLVFTTPILAQSVSTQTSNQTKSQCNAVEKGLNPLYVIPENNKGLIRKDSVPKVLKIKPLSPQPCKDYHAALLYAEDYYLEVGTSKFN